MLWILLATVFSCPSIAAEAGESKPTKVNHVVIAWLKDPGNESARQRFIKATKRFSTFPGVIAHRVGTVSPSGRKVVDSSFDVAAVITFKDQAALSSYLQHPIHRKAVDEVLKPLVERMVVYDFVSD